MSTATQQEVNTPAAASIGNFVWHELRTTDARAAIDFYCHVVGWQTKPSGDPNGIPYTLFTVGGAEVAGVMELSADMLAGGMRPSWAGFIGVDDVDGYARRAEQAGGKLHCPPQDIPSVGRWASVEDPQGASFLFFTPQPRVAAYAQPAFGSPGTVGWNELSANNGDDAWSFYSGLKLGWKEDSVMDMGPLGLYRIFSNGGQSIGGMMTRDPANSPVPFWLYYFSVDDIDAAVNRTKEKSGQILMGPHEVPGNMFIVLGMDPQGSMFALVAPGKPKAEA